MSLRIWQLAVCVMHVHQVPVALGVAVVTRGLVTFERHVLSRMPHRRLGCHHRVDSCRWCLFVLPLCSLHASAFGFVKAQVFFVTSGEPGRASFSTDGVDCRCCRCYVSEAQPLRSLYLL